MWRQCLTCDQLGQCCIILYINSWFKVIINSAEINIGLDIKYHYTAHTVFGFNMTRTSHLYIPKAFY